MRGLLFLRSTTAGFVMLAFVLQCLVTGGALLYVQQGSQRAFVAEQRELIGELRDELVASWRSSGSNGLRRLIRTRLATTHGSPAVILFVTANGTPIAGNLDAWPTVIAPDESWRRIELYRTGSDRPEHMDVTAARLADGSRLLVGHVIETNLRLLRINQEAVLVALVSSLALALLGALVIGRLLSRRIEGVAATAKAVGDGGLAARVSTDGSDDAFDMLGRSINAMLDRIEALVSQLRMMTDGLAHDLRSPLTRMKSLIERTAGDMRDPDALAALERVSQEADILLKMLATALQISRAEAGIGRDRFAPVRVDALLEDLAEIYGPLAEDQGFAIAVATVPGLQAPLHREFMSQALGNLIENALKYAVGGTKIILGGTPEQGALVLSVADDGPGIPADSRAEALRRFGRLDPARHLSGSGLGLALVEAVARLHDGEIALQANSPGLRVELRLRVGGG